MKFSASISIALLTASFAALADVNVAVNTAPNHLSGWFGVDLTSAAEGPLESDTGVTDGTGAWTDASVAGGVAEVCQTTDGRFLSVRTDGVTEAVFEPRATDDATFRTEDFTVRFPTFASEDPYVAPGTKSGFTLVKRGDADACFSVCENGSWTDVYLGDGSTVPTTNVWYEGRAQFRRDADGLNAAYLIKTASGYQVLHAADGTEWFLAGTGSAVSNVTFSGAGDLRAVGGRRLAGLFVTVP